MPPNLSKPAQDFWRSITEKYEVSSPDLVLLTQACRAMDRAEQCRRAVDKEGVSQLDRYGNRKPHPLVAEERQQRDLVRRAIATLNFEVEEADADG